MYSVKICGAASRLGNEATYIGQSNAGMICHVQSESREKIKVRKNAFAINRAREENEKEMECDRNETCREHKHERVSVIVNMFKQV